MQSPCMPDAAKAASLRLRYVVTNHGHSFRLERMINNSTPKHIANITSFAHTMTENRSGWFTIDIKPFPDISDTAKLVAATHKP